MPLLDLLAPPVCVACRRPTSGQICGECLRRLPWLRGHRCPRCALPRHRAGCPAAAAAFDRAWAPLAYDATARDIVHALKFHAALPVAGLMAAHMAANLPADLRRPPPGLAPQAELRQPPTGLAPQADLRQPPTGLAPQADLRRPLPAASLRPPFAPALAVVPVPPHRGRLRRRGFDPAALLAAGVAARAGLALAPCLRRADRGRRQVGAGRSLRRSAGRFAAVVTATPPRAVVLVDDVHTTGATLDACARALAAGGSGWIVAVTYARTL